MRIGFLVDATCDLPRSYYESGDVLIMPIAVRIKDYTVSDTRDEEATRQYLESDLASEGTEAETSAYTVEQISTLFLERLVIEYDYVFCLTVTRTRSEIFDNATQASYSILNEYRPIREAAGNRSPFSLRVIDTGNLFTGVGIPLIAGLRMREQGEQPPLIRARLEHIAKRTQAFAVVPDLYYVRNRARKKGDRSVGLFGAMLGSALDIKPILYCNQGVTRPIAKVRGFENAVEKLFADAAAQIRRGLIVSVVNMSYGGPLEKMRAFPGYEQLAEACRESSVTLLESQMSMTGAVNMGPGTVTIAYATENPVTLS